jgi:hypothetical protein
MLWSVTPFPQELRLVIWLLAQDSEEILDRETTPHLSYSRINRYLTCPEQYRLYYVPGLSSAPWFMLHWLICSARAQIPLIPFAVNGEI